MKYSIGLLSIICLLSCAKQEINMLEQLNCSEEALFRLLNTSGEMFFMPCYDTWAIRLDERDANDIWVIGASYDIPEAFQEEGLIVSFDACFLPFDMPLVLADPNPWGHLFVVDDFSIRAN